MLVTRGQKRAAELAKSISAEGGSERNTVDSSLAHLPLEGANLLGEAEPRKATCKDFPFTKKALVDPGPMKQLRVVLLYCE
jgi:hypothetical protein